MIEKIVDLMLAQVNKTLAKKGITLDVTEEAKDLLMEQGYDKAMGRSSITPRRRN